MKPMYEIFYRALGGKVQSKDGLSNLVQRQTGGTTGRRVREFNPQLLLKEIHPNIPLCQWFLISLLFLCLIE